MRRVLAGLTAVVLAAAATGWWAARSGRDGPRPTPRADATATAQVRVSERSPRRGTRADAPWGELAGRVSDLDGRAVSGALVVAQDLHGLAGAARSGDDGHWRMALGRWDRLDPRWPDRGWPDARQPARTVEMVVAAQAEGRTRSNTRAVVARRGDVVAVGPLALYVGGRIEGRVVDSEGHEVPGRVRVLGVESKDTVDGMQAIAPPFPVDSVDAVPGEGYRIGPVGPGTVELWATSPGVGTAHGTVVVGEGQTVRVDLPVRVERGISGRVLDTTGAVVSACRVVCVPQAERADGARPKMRPLKPRTPDAPDTDPVGTLAGRPLATDTDAEGRFWFYGLRAEAPHTVAVGDTTEPGADGSSVRGVLPGTDDVLLVAPIRHDLVGVVRDAVTGTAVEGAGVQRFPAGQAQLLRLTRPLGLVDAGREGPSSASDGRFRLEHVFAGEHVLHVTRAGYEPAEVAVTVGVGVPAPLEVRLVPAARVTATVIDVDGARAAGARIVVSPAPVEGPRSVARAAWSGRITASADADGVAHVSGLPADVDLVLRVTDASGASARLALRLVRSEDRALELRLRPAATLVVHVRPATDGTRAGHPVRLRGLDDPDVQIDVETDSDGEARVTHLPPGRYEVLATDPLENPTKPGVASRIAVIDLAEGVETEHAVTVPDFTELRGTLREDGVDVRAARVGFGPLPGTPDHFRPLLFEVRDRVWSGRVPPGRYHVHIAYPGRRHEFDEPVTISAAPSQTLDLEFPPR